MNVFTIHHYTHIGQCQSLGWSAMCGIYSDDQFISIVNSNFCLNIRVTTLCDPILIEYVKMIETKGHKLNFRVVQEAVLHVRWCWQISWSVVIARKLSVSACILASNIPRDIYQTRFLCLWTTWRVVVAHRIWDFCCRHTKFLRNRDPFDGQWWCSNEEQITSISTCNSDGKFSYIINETFKRCKMISVVIISNLLCYDLTLRA